MSSLQPSPLGAGRIEERIDLADLEMERVNDGTHLQPICHGYRRRAGGSKEAVPFVRGGWVDRVLPGQRALVRRAESGTAGMGRQIMKMLRISMGDGSQWDVPVEAIARHRAETYARQFGGDVERSLKEDTIPLFEADPFEIHDWASNNMNWKDVKDRAVVAVPSCRADYQEGWVNGHWQVVEIDAGGRPRIIRENLS